MHIWRETVVERLEPAHGGVRLIPAVARSRSTGCVYATGRAPRAADRGASGLEACGVRLQPSGTIAVDAEYRSSNPGIFAVGDCGDHAGTALDGMPFDLTPVAIAEGRALAETQFNANPQGRELRDHPDGRVRPAAGGDGRPVGGEGARPGPRRSQVFRTSFRPMFHTLTGMTPRTMMKLVVDKATDRVLGCHMVGEDAAEIIQGFAVALTAGATKRVFDATVALHPTAAEEFVTMYQPATG